MTGIVLLIYIRTLPIFSYFALSYLPHSLRSLFLFPVILVCHIFSIGLLLFILIKSPNYLSCRLCVFFDIGSTFSSCLIISFLQLGFYFSCHVSTQLSQSYMKIWQKIEDIHSSWLYCFTNSLELLTHVSLSHRQPGDVKAKHVTKVQEDLWKNINKSCVYLQLQGFTKRLQSRSLKRDRKSLYTHLLWHFL